MAVSTAAALLRELEALKTEFGHTVAHRKLVLLSGLGRGRLGRAADVFALHEQLCFMRVYPDDTAVLQCVEQLLQGFDRRPDLRRHAAWTLRTLFGMDRARLERDVFPGITMGQDARIFA